MGSGVGVGVDAAEGVALGVGAAVVAGAEVVTDTTGAGVPVFAFANEIPANRPPTTRRDAAAPKEADFLSIP